ncbi:MAG: isoprenylcysteine carboxylmethyltransferase family protein [Rhizobiaceae bacterium]
MKPLNMLPPHYFATSLISMLTLGYFFEEPLLPDTWHLVGIAPIVLGVVFASVAARQFTKARTNIVPLTISTTLVTNGIFAVTRNPMYVGMVVILIGTALLLNDLWPWFVIPLFWLVIRIGFVRHEETLMEQTFGEQYVKYKARVRRWL